MPQALNPLCHTQVGRIPFSHFPGVIKNWPSPAWKWKGGKISEQNWLNRLQMAQFECPRPSTDWCHLLMKPSVCVVWAPFLLSVSSFKRRTAPQIAVYSPPFVRVRRSGESGTTEFSTAQPRTLPYGWVGYHLILKYSTVSGIFRLLCFSPI